MDADNVGAPVTKQQWDYIHKMGDALRQSFENVSAVFAPSCISHSVLTKRDWMNVKIDDISIAQAIHCWEHHPFRKFRKRRKNLRSFSIEPSLINRINVKQSNDNQRMSLSADSAPKHKRRRRKRRRRNRKNGKNANKKSK